MPPKAQQEPEMDEEDANVEVAPKDLDDKSLRAFMGFHKTLTEDPHIIRFFDRKGYYSVHGPAANTIARQFYRTTAVVRGADSGLPYVNVNRAMFETILRELLLGGTAHIVELYESVGTGWKLVRSATPGKLSAFDEELYRSAEMSEVPLVAAITFTVYEGQVTAGVAYVDAASCRLGACEMVLDDQLSGLEAVLVQLGAREAVVNKDSLPLLDAGQRSRLTALLESVGLMVTERPAGLFSAKHLEADLAKVIKGGAVEQHGDVLERRTACSALAAVLSYAEVMSECGQSGSGGRYVLSLYNSGCYMRLDATAQRALNVLPTRTDANATYSLYGLLNRCRTAMGKRRLKTWLKQPLVELAAIAQRHDAVEAMKGDAEMRQRLRDQQFRGLPDVERLTRKLQSRRISLQELHQLYRASARLPLIEEAIRCHEGPHAANLVERYADPLAQHHDGEHLQRFEELLEAALDLERLPEEYLISPSYDNRLATLSEAKQQLEEEIADLAQSAADDLGLILDKTLKLEWHRAANVRTRCLRITQKEEKNVRSKLQAKYLVIETRKDGTKFTNRALRDAAERLNAASGQYLALQSELVEQVVSVAHTFVEVWEAVAAILAELDVLLSFAEAADVAPVPYVRPDMLGPDEGIIELRECRHPNVEVQDGVSFIVNDCVMKRGESWFQIITGPNMGGKSTYIRQGASSHSLVIIDELGRGTSTYDGFGLAWAISEHLAGPDVGAPTLFATHFHELTELKAAVGVKNMQATAIIDPATQRLTMLYRIGEGACDQSFGVHVAESAGFPPQVIAMANQRLKQLEAGQARLHVPAAKRLRTEGGGAPGPHHNDDEAAAAADVAELQSFLRRFSSLPLDGMSPEDAVTAVDHLLTALPQRLMTAVAM
ncbi:hypothetical protein VOLCADRAFT_96164 [Volvox carteri f. nagariensis]|uniref:DNA mismatch repair proteins mutS family domain-containing protein n=1 Tax=Volvox carteri f. nagariensis TaxID=3068 RepID=D8U9D7_VOLCA|nr:uncharacterized protein VOLCADRAFT_96164 [Volvox carteri f. nagariensis]EFJ43623.1 hypothetical protein VOLCADRAFT_96164 [Volvox carteri f. nagariensis]|eukprot:XP_002955323.1 hypothetical protein VOLCADRAFT_96164 [Volvox carteri f. nagariensis]